MPSIADLGIKIILAFQNALSSMSNVSQQANFAASSGIIKLRILGAFAEIEVSLPLLVWYTGRNSKGNDYFKGMY